MVLRLLISSASLVWERRLLKLEKSDCFSRILVMLKAETEEGDEKNTRKRARKKKKSVRGRSQEIRIETDAKDGFQREEISERCWCCA